MPLFDAKHKKEIEENGRKLKERLEAKVASGPQGDGLFDKLSFNFSQSLLHEMQTRKVK